MKKFKNGEEIKITYDEALQSAHSQQYNPQPMPEKQQ